MTAASPATAPAASTWRELLDLRFFVVAAAAAVLIAVVSAIPTAIIANPWFTRMTPVYADQYFFWLGTSVLAGALLATYLPGRSLRGSVGGAGGGALAYLAIGCPICNKLIVGLLGVSGALSYFQPIQPFLGGVGLVLVAAALAYRMRDLSRGSCRVVDR